MWLLDSAVAFPILFIVILVGQYGILILSYTAAG